jgi:hypothetical protein
MSEKTGRAAWSCVIRDSAPVRVARRPRSSGGRGRNGRAVAGPSPGTVRGQQSRPGWLLRRDRSPDRNRHVCRTVTRHTGTPSRPNACPTL